MHAAEPTSAVELGSSRLTVARDGSVGIEGDHPAADIVRTVLGAAAEHERTIDVDMTNWVRVVDERWMVKVGLRFGLLDRAARLLDRLEGTGVAPAHYGAIEVEGHPIATVGEFIPGSTDGWTWAVDDVVAHVRGGPAPRWPDELGRLCARMHLALAAGAEAAPGPDGAALRARALAALEEALATTEGAAGVRLRNRASGIRAAIECIPDRSSAPAFELHGDLHVGQVLRAGDRYVVIDFDGDPQLSAQQRDAPDVAARDVAHLMSSLELVGSVARKHVGVHPDVTEWARRAQVVLLAAYASTLDDAGRADLLDPDQLAGLHAEQLLRELIYAHRFLPRWQYAADAAITFHYEPDDDTEEEPWMPPASPTT